MYILKIENEKYTMPKKNIVLLALFKAKDRNEKIAIRTPESAIEYLKSIGVEVINAT